MFEIVGVALVVLLLYDVADDDEEEDDDDMDVPPVLLGVNDNLNGSTEGKNRATSLVGR
jgi:hypothetical protein